MKTRYLVGTFVAALLFVVTAIVLVVWDNRPASLTPLRYTYEIVNVFPHDSDAFTQGLVFDGGFLYEGTGLYSHSTLRRVDLTTGEVFQNLALSDEYFGEGITIIGDRIIQLTWRSERGFVYDKNTFNMTREFSYPTEGWGLTHDGSQLIMSDGTSKLYFLNPETFERTEEINVHDAAPVTKLNELEYIKGEIYANIWQEQEIAVINPQTGRVTAWIDLSGIEGSEVLGPESVLNGIAYDAETDRLFVTGKNWPHLYEIRLTLSNE